MVCALNAAQEAGIPFQAVVLKDIADETHLFGLDRSRLLEDPGKPNFRDDTKALIASSPGPVYSFISVIKHVQFGLRSLDYPSELPFDFVYPGAPQLPLDRAAEIVPADAMRDALRAAVWMRLKMVRRLIDAAPGRVVQFAPPPPVSDQWLGRWLATKTAHHRMPNRIVRWKLWTLTADLFRDQAERFGARFVMPPPEAVDADGFMRDELVRNVTHGNLAFGRLLLQQMRQLA